MQIAGGESDAGVIGRPSLQQTRILARTRRLLLLGEVPISLQPASIVGFNALNAGDGPHGRRAWWLRRLKEFHGPRGDGSPSGVPTRG